MPDIKLYDYQRPEGLPAGTMWTTSFPIPGKRAGKIVASAPWADEHMMVCYYGEDEKLLGVRFVNRDGTYKDLI